VRDYSDMSRTETSSIRYPSTISSRITFPRTDTPRYQLQISHVFDESAGRYRNSMFSSNHIFACFTGRTTKPSRGKCIRVSTVGGVSSGCALITTSSGDRATRDPIVGLKISQRYAQIFCIFRSSVLISTSVIWSH
jgi:hypothetical protein